MGILNIIKEHFNLTMTAEEENKLRAKISDFNVAVQQMSERYIPFEEINEFKERWDQIYKEIKAIHISKNKDIYSEARQFLQDYDQISDIFEAKNNSFIEKKSQQYDSLLSDIDGKSLDKQQRTVVP